MRGAGVLGALLLAGAGPGGSPDWASSKGFYRARVLEGPRLPLGGFFVRIDPRGDGLPELFKSTDRHTVWGHSMVPAASFGKIVPGVPVDRREESPDPFTRRISYALSGGSRCVFTARRFHPALFMDCRAPSFAAFRMPPGAGPRHFAYLSDRGIAVVPRPGEAVPGDQLLESWILVWWGQESPHRLSFVPSFLDLAPDPIDREDHEKYVRPQPADAPWLISFQSRPTRIALERDGLSVDFASPAGITAFLPLGGFRWYRGSETAGWARNFPPEVADRCRAWNRRLKCIPESFEEEYAVEGDAVEVRTSFSFYPVGDDWRTPGVRFAPLAPVTALALLSGLGNLSTTPASPVDPAYPTLVGTLAGFEDVESYRVRFTGWKKYAEPPVPPPVRRRDPRILDRLERHVREMLEAGHLAPYESFQGTMQYSFWGRPADLASTLLAVRRHVGEELQKGIDRYLREENAKYPVLKWGWTPPEDGARREGHPVDLSVPDAVGRRRRAEAAGVESLWGLWEYGSHFEDWGWLDSQWNLVREAVHRRDDTLDWELGLHRAGVHELNLRIKGLLGYLWICRRKGDRRAEDEAVFLLVQALVQRFAFAKLSGHRFLSGQYVVPPEFDLPRFHARNAHKFNVFLPAYRKGADWRTAPQVGFVWTVDRYLSEIGNFWHDHAVLAWADLTPNLARFLADTAMAEQRNYLACIDEGLPTWYVAKAENLHAAGEDAYFSPLVSWPVFQARAMIFREPAASLARYLDLPYGRGDLYYLQNLVAALEAE